MTSKLLLRISSILMLVHLVGHTIGHSGWAKDPDPAKRPVIQAMTGPKFPFMGVTRSMGEYFDGYGYVVSLYLLLLSILLWLASNDSAGGSRFRNQMVFVAGAMLVATGLLEIVFFFPFAAAISLLAGLFTLGAAYSLH